MKQLLILLALVTIVAARGKKSSSCIKPVKVQPLQPPSVVAVTEKASKHDPSFKSDIRIIQGNCKNNPTFLPVESVIEQYAKSHFSVISKLEYYDAHPSAVVSVSSFTQMKTKFPKLASAVSSLVSEEASHISLEDIQSTLQSLFVSYPTILTVGASSFDVSYSSLKQCESGISEAEVKSPSVVADVQALTTFESLWPSMSKVLCELSSVAYYYPTVLHDVTLAEDWSQPNAWREDKTLRSIATCYLSVYQAFVSIESFLDKHSSAETAFTNFVQVLSSVPSIVSDVTSFAKVVSSSFTRASSEMRPAINNDPHISTEISYLDVLEASYPSLSCAEKTLEREIHSHPDTVYSILLDMASPSRVNDPTNVSSLEKRYPSIVSAYSEVERLTCSHPSLSYVQQVLTQEERVVPSLLTDANDVISAASPSLEGDAYQMEKVESVAPGISVALYSLSYIEKQVPSLSCEESVVAQYAVEAPSVVYEIDEAIAQPQLIASSSIKYYEQLTAKYRSLASAERKVFGYQKRFPQLATIQKELTFALSYEPHLLSVYKSLGSHKRSLSKEITNFAPPVHKKH
jgi:hypothetical protein